MELIVKLLPPEYLIQVRPCLHVDFLQLELHVGSVALHCCTK